MEFHELSGPLQAVTLEGGLGGAISFGSVTFCSTQSNKSFTLLKGENPMKLENIVTSFIKARQADGRVARTIQDYERVLNPFADWCEKQAIEVEELDRDSVRDYVCVLRTNDWCENTLSIYIRVLRSFLAWMHEEGKKGENLAQAIKPPKETLEDEDLLTEDELRRMLKTCQGYKQAARDRALILTMLDTGLRVGEMTLLENKQLHLEPDGKTMWLLAYAPKVNLVHFSFFGIRTTQAMQAYLKERRDDWPSLWIGIRGPLTSLGIYRALRRRSDAAEIEPGRVYPHAFRKLFATMWTDNGGDPTTLMRVGGWKSMSVLKRYILLSGRSKLSKLHRRYSPSDALLGDTDTE